MLLCVGITTMQSQKKNDCDFNFRKALFYLKGDKNFKKDTLKSINYLKPCLKIDNANAQLLMARIYLSKKSKKNNKKAFKLLKKSANQDNIYAVVDLAVLYKYGIGCKLNLNKARKWFKKGAELGSQKAAYSLGYLYLKGFGDINQDYNKAVKWFKKSEYPMANYWLGVCYYYGYGVSQNLKKANELLGTDFKNIPISSQKDSNTENPINEFSEVLSYEKEEANTLIDITDENIYGTWVGKLLKFDWSNKHVEQKHNFTIAYKYDSITEIPRYTFYLENTPLNGAINRLGNEIYFDNFQIRLPHASFHEKIPTKIDYQFLSADLSLKKIGELTFLTGNIESYISEWNEKGAPLRFVLQKQETFSNSDRELSDEVLKALSEQKNNFIKLYPNPFKSDLNISFTLENASYVEVKITDINGTKNSIVEKGKQQKTGKHTYFFNGTGLKKGLYVVTVTANNEKKTRIIVKK